MVCRIEPSRANFRRQRRKTASYRGNFRCYFCYTFRYANCLRKFFQGYEPGAVFKDALGDQLRLDHTVQRLGSRISKAYGVKGNQFTCKFFRHPQPLHRTCGSKCVL